MDYRYPLLSHQPRYPSPVFRQKATPFSLRRGSSIVVKEHSKHRKNEPRVLASTSAAELNGA
ncbi:MAG: hypothetical protein ACTSUE_27080 [Promethearchaeota archaeon]